MYFLIVDERKVKKKKKTCKHHRMLVPLVLFGLLRMLRQPFKTTLSPDLEKEPRRR